MTFRNYGGSYGGSHGESHGGSGDSPNHTPDHGNVWTRLFTVDEANAALPDVVPMLVAMRDAKRELDDARHRLAQLTPKMRSNGSAALATELEGRIDTFTRDIADGLHRLVAMGVEVKDIERGLIDFPALRDDRVVYLCWQLGEGPIAYWHEIDAGFAGRRPI